jgi:hypothetical protein
MEEQNQAGGVAGGVPEEEEDMAEKEKGKKEEPHGPRSDATIEPVVLGPRVLSIDAAVASATVRRTREILRSLRESERR